VQELAARLAVPEEELLQAFECGAALANPPSLDGPTPAGVGTAAAAGRADQPTLGDAVGGHDPALRAFLLYGDLRTAVERLGSRERQVVEMRFLHDLSQREVAEALGVSQMHVSRLQKRALERLHTWLEGTLPLACTRALAERAATSRRSAMARARHLEP
jgi:RNA polymerase sigma-B factor